MLHFTEQHVLAFCRAFPLRYVAGDLGRADDRAVAAPDRRDRQGNVDERAVFTSANRLKMIDPLSCVDPRQNRRLFVQSVLRDENGDGPDLRLRPQYSQRAVPRSGSRW